MNNATALIDLYQAHVNRHLDPVEAARMTPIIKELREMAQWGDAVPGAADLLATTDADALLQLLAITTGEDLQELQALAITAEQAAARVFDEVRQHLWQSESLKSQAENSTNPNTIGALIEADHQLGLAKNYRA